MVKRVGGFRRKSRHKFMKYARQRGKISLTRYLQEFQKGDKVVLHVEPAYHKGMYHPRFIGKYGTVQGKRGRCYEIAIVDGNKEKSLIVHPVHLMRG